MEILEEKPLTYSEVKEILKEVNPNLRTEKLKEFLNSFDLVDVSKVEEIKKEIENLNIMRLKGKDKLIIQIINMMPKSIEELINILSGEKITLAEEDLKKILEILDKYRG